MKLSDSTLSLLKNFSTINTSILFKAGNRLRTISVMKNILAEVTIAEEDDGAYVFVSVNEDAQEGSHNFAVTVSSGSNVLESFDLTQFCTTKEHALYVARYFIKLRE